MSSLTRAIFGALALLQVLAPGAPLQAQDNYSRVAGEYAISGGLMGDQVYPSVAIRAGGGYTVWQDNVTDGDGAGISAQRLNDNLSGSLAPFRVNQIGAGHQERPRVAMLPDGGAVFVWQGGAPGFQKIYARFLNAAGTFITGDILVNTFIEHQQFNPSVAVLNNGSVVVVWSSSEQDGHLQGVFGQRLSVAGDKLGAEFRVNEATLYNQRTPSVTALSGGGFAVAWISETLLSAGGDAFAVDIHARTYDAAGEAQSGEFKVNTAAATCANPALSRTEAGGLVLVWTQRDDVVLTNSWDVFTRTFTAAGTAVTSAALVNTTTYGDQYSPRIASKGASHFVIWTSLGQDGSEEGVFGRVLSSAGVPAGSELPINSSTLSQQFHPDVAADGTSRYLVVWSSYVTGGTGCDLFAQRYASAQPLPVLPPPAATALSQSRMLVSWAELAGYDVQAYLLYVNGSATPITTTNHFHILTGAGPGSAHTFRLEYLLRDGRRSPLSGVASGNTWGEDLNFDGLPDDWQARYWGTNPANWPPVGVDSDGDGATNVQEFLAGTNPTDRNSSLRLVLQSTGQGIWLDWNTEGGSVYQVQCSTNAVDWINLGKTRFAPGALDSLAVGGGDRAIYRVIRTR